MSFTVGATVGPYEIVEERGHGGMATVYKATHTALDRHVAIKVLHPGFKNDASFLRRFQREARVVARLEHPNIVSVYDYAEHEGYPYLVMRYIEGVTLKERLSEGPLTQEEILRVATAVAEGLDYAHSQGVLHRDVKPSNILLTGNKGVYITDFGLARITQAGESTMSQDMIMGTPQYISPEQAKGGLELDNRTDLYSFGVILYELVTGRVPFNAETSYTVIHDHIFTPPPRPREINPAVPPAMENVLLKALAKNPNNRYTTAAEMVAAFKAAAAGGLPQPAVEPAALDPTQATTAFPAPLEATRLAPLPDLLSEDTPSSDGPDNGLAGNNAVVADTVVAPVPAGPVAATAVSPARIATQPRQRPLLLILGGIVLGMLLCAGVVLGLSRLQRIRQAQTREATQQAVVAAGTATAQAATAATAIAAAVPTLPPTSLPGPDIPRPPLLPALDRVRPVEVLEPLVAADPGNLALKSELALAYLQAGQNEQARELFEEVLQNVRNPLAIAVAAERLMELGRFDMATLFLENGLARFPEERTLQHLLLMSYIFSEQAPEVVQVFLDRLPEDAEGKMNRSIGAVYLAYRGGDLPQAQAMLDEALAAPGSLYRSELYYLQGLLFLQSGDSEQARNAFQEALLNDPPTWLMPHIRERLAQ